MKSNSAKLIELFRRGEIEEYVLILHGVSGNLPSEETYRSMSRQEKTQFWQQKMQSKYGKQWKELFHSLPALLNENSQVNWTQEGF